jgi:pimeloyl-ACP methyl ester carboxylesterase
VAIEGFARENLSVRLHDGRLLGYADYGDPQGEPVMFFHGTPSSRLLFRVGDAAARLAGVRLIAPDRPGIGLSTHRPGRRIADWPADVLELANHLGFDRFSVVGISGGGPYAIACAQFIPERLRAAGAVSGMGPLDVPALVSALKPSYRGLFALARRAGVPYAVFSNAVGAAVRCWPASILAYASGGEPQDERRDVMSSDAWAALKAATLEAFRGGSAGPAHDVYLLATAWGFAPATTRVPVVMWHGNADTIVPVAMTRHIAERMRDCYVTIIPGAGHFWGLTNAATILGGLKSAA